MGVTKQKKSRPDFCWSCKKELLGNKKPSSEEETPRGRGKDDNWLGVSKENEMRRCTKQLGGGVC